MVKYSDEEVLEAYRTLGTQTAASKALGISQSYVHKVMKRNGVKADGIQRISPQNRKVSDAELIEACKTLSSGEIQERYDIKQCTLYERCKRLGIKPIRKKQEYNRGLDKCIRRQQLFKDVWHYWEPHANKFSGIEGITYLESKSVMARVRCDYCGEVLEINTRGDRVNSPCCKKCAEREKEEAQISDAQAKLVRVLRCVAEYKVPKICPRCGDVFYSANNKKVFCSDKCRKLEKKNSYRNRCRKYGVYYDSTIRRKDVIKRDKGVCQICGKLCDPSDRSWGSSGPNYPTLDHIRPLAKGGAHTWDNVQCACGMCNSTKRDLLYG